MGGKGITGDTGTFDRSWRTRPETAYNHWTRQAPRNQIQLAFRAHWEVFQEVLGPLAAQKGAVLEVGCGRGSLSSYFADAGWDVTLLDSSENVLASAREAFGRNGHKATFRHGDAKALPFPDDSFEATFSIGLLEHFEDVRPVIAEQLRVLKPGGWFLGYVVPERPDNLQRYFNWMNRILRMLSRLSGGGKQKQPKPQVYRSDFGSEHYVRAMQGLAYADLTIFGMYSLPMISHSPEFPFTLLPRPLERLLTSIFRAVLSVRRLLTGRHGWICSERMGQAFLLAFRKPVAAR